MNWVTRHALHACHTCNVLIVCNLFSVSRHATGCTQACVHACMRACVRDIQNLSLSLSVSLSHSFSSLLHLCLPGLVIPSLYAYTIFVTCTHTCHHPIIQYTKRRHNYTRQQSRHPTFNHICYTRRTANRLLCIPAPLSEHLRPPVGHQLLQGSPARPELTRWMYVCICVHVFNIYVYIYIV